MISTVFWRNSYICSQCYCNILRARASNSRKLPPNFRRSIPPTLFRHFSSPTKSFSASAYPTYQDRDEIDPEFDTASRISDLLSKKVPRTEHKPLNPSHPFQTWQSATRLRPIVRQTLMKAYPHVHYLTPIQALILAGMDKRVHVCVADTPGTGKSFAVATWLLNISRSTATVGGVVKPTTTAFVVVPNPSLARQYQSWIRTLLENSGSEELVKRIKDFVQAVYRSADAKEIENQERDLREFPNPHILIGTPTRLLDLLSEPVETRESGGREKQWKPLDIDHLKNIVLDEADTLLDMNSTSKSCPTPKTGRPVMFPSPPTPTTELLDYIFKRRNLKLVSPVRSRLPTNLIQLALLSSSISAKTMRRWIDSEKKQWVNPFPDQLMAPEGGGSKNYQMGFAPGMLTSVEKSALVTTIVLAIQREPTISGAVLSRIHKNVKHYIVGYDLKTGLLRDAPLNRSAVQIAMRDMFDEENKMWSLVRDKFPSSVDPKRKKRKLSPEQEEQIKAFLLQQKVEASAERSMTEEGYPERISVKIVESLLKRDDWPRNVLIGLAPMASKIEFRDMCRKRGIGAEILSFETWNAKYPESPIGRTDDRIVKLGNAEQRISETEVSKRQTTLWITDAKSCAGLDTPGTFHAYLLHRIATTRDYVSYCGRISRHPFPDPSHRPDNISKTDEDALRGKVVSVILQQAITPEEYDEERAIESGWEIAQDRGKKFKGRQGPGYKTGKGEKIVRFERPARDGLLKEIGVVVVKAGSMFEKDAWIREGVRREKIGCTVVPYFSKSKDEFDSFFGYEGEEKEQYYEELGNSGRRRRELESEMEDVDMKDEDATLSALKGVNTISVEELQKVIAEKKTIQSSGSAASTESPLDAIYQSPDPDLLAAPAASPTTPESAQETSGPQFELLPLSQPQEASKFQPTIKPKPTSEAEPREDDTETRTHALTEIVLESQSTFETQTSPTTPETAQETSSPQFELLPLSQPQEASKFQSTIKLKSSSEAEPRQDETRTPALTEIVLESQSTFETQTSPTTPESAQETSGPQFELLPLSQPQEASKFQSTVKLKSASEAEPRQDDTETRTPALSEIVLESQSTFETHSRLEVISIEAGPNFEPRPDGESQSEGVTPSTESELFASSELEAFPVAIELGLAIGSHPTIEPQFTENQSSKSNPETLLNVQAESTVKAEIVVSTLPIGGSSESQFVVEARPLDPESLPTLEAEATIGSQIVIESQFTSESETSPESQFTIDSRPDPKTLPSFEVGLTPETLLIPAAQDSAKSQAIPKLLSAPHPVPTTLSCSEFITTSPVEYAAPSKTESDQLINELDNTNHSPPQSSPSPTTERELISDDPTLTPQDLAQFRQAQKEIRDSYDELCTLIGEVWNKIENAEVGKEILVMKASKEDLEKLNTKSEEQEGESVARKEGQNDNPVRGTREANLKSVVEVEQREGQVHIVSAHRGEELGKVEDIETENKHGDIKELERVETFLKKIN